MKQAKCLVLYLLTLTLAVLLGTMPNRAQEPAEWTPELGLAVKRLSDLSFSPDGGHLLYGINSVDLENDRYLTSFVISGTDGSGRRVLLDPSPHISSAQWSPDGKSIAYLSTRSGHSSIWVIASGGGESRQVTDLKQDISSFRWAPDGRSIGFVMPDPDYVDPGVEDPALFNRNHLWLVSPEGGDPTNLTANQSFSVSAWSGNWAYDWSPDSKRIVFAHQEGPGLDFWTEAQLSIVDVDTLQVNTVETDNRFWKYFPKFSPDGKWLAFINAPGPFKWSFLWSIKLMPADGGETVTLNSKNRLPFPWQWAPDSQSLYYVENDRTTYSFYRMPVDGSPYKKVFGSPDDLSVPGLNTYLVSSFVDIDESNRKLAFIGQTYSTPPEIYVSDVDRFRPEKITEVNRQFDDIKIGRTELVRWKSLDNTEVEGLLTYPTDFAEGKDYPLVVQIHGGPNGVDFNEYLPLMKFLPTAAFAADGYFVLRPNYRGTLGYGQKFREDLIGNFGVLDIQDILSGVNDVINRGLANPDQLFVVGQSNGGTMTSWIITQTQRFKAACPIAGETDYISLEGTDGYFQTSWYLGGSFIDHLQRFIDRSPIFHVKNVTTPTLIQGGLLDDNVPHSQLKEFYRALKRVGVDVELVGYPDSDHDEYPPKLYLRLLRSCLDWTNKHRDAAIGN